MAILENIRKRTTVLILIIGLALFAFVVSGIFTQQGFSGGKAGSSVAEINGNEISIDDFRAKVERASRRGGSQNSSMQTINNVWNQLERNTILGQQIENLGINIEQDQIINLIKSNPGFTQNPQFLNDNGLFDEGKFRSFISELKVNAPGQYQDWLQDEESIIQAAKENAYFNLIKAGTVATLREGELDYKLANDKVDIRYVRVPYTSIADSTVIISKKEISDYVEKHKETYRQEKARDLQYVYFEDKPSTGDDAAVKQLITDLLKDTEEYNASTDTNDTLRGFRNTRDMAAFLDRNSDTKFDTVYKSLNELPSKFADTLMTLNPGEIYGPYKDGDAYKISKVVSRKANGSVKASHILIAYAGAERANPEVTRTKEEAEVRALQMLKEATAEGAVFAEIARDNSDGPSAPQGGDLGFFQEGVMTPKFNDFAFGNNVGHIGLVETEFGFHIVKVDQKQDVIQLATLSRAIEPSEETINGLFTDATKFEMAATDSDKTFPDLAKEANHVVRPVNKLTALDENLPGLGAQRSIVQWAFNDDTEVGDIRRFGINNGYAVVQLTYKYNEGVMAPEDASATVLPILRKEKKAERIMAANKGKSMEELASSNNTNISTATALTVKTPTIPGAGREPAVVGTAVSLAQGASSGLLEGETGIFLVEVTRKEEAPVLDNYATFANALKTASAAKVTTAVYDALKDKSEIEDSRALFY